MASVTLKKVWKKFGDTTIIKDVSIDIQDGEFCVLVGPSGSGKSTLLRMIAGLEELSAGDLFIADRNVSDVPAKSRDIAMVFQSYALYPQMTVRDNMGFGLKLQGVPKQEIEKKINAAAAKLNLTPLLGRYPRQLSGGQRQRVAMGRAIVRDPKVFLFDEPLSNLDAALRTQVRGEIRELHESLKTTSIYVTHDQIEAMTMGDRIVVLRDGMVEQVGSPLELYDRPSNTFVASFIGSPSINLFKATVKRAPDGFIAELSDGQQLPVPFTQVGSLSDGLAITIGIRPEHLSVSSGASPAQIRCTVNSIEQTGADSRLMASSAKQADAFALTAVLSERFMGIHGQEVALDVDYEHMHVFDQKSGQRI
jgi:multiple sugar transport system ATP-binding protein